MQKQIFFAIILMSSVTQAQVAVDWFNYPGGVGIATDSANNVYTANWDYNPAGDITLTKRNPAGTILWNATYDNTDNTRHEVATWVETDHSGDIIVSGTIRSGYSNPVNAASVLMKYNPAGVLLWRVVYENSFDGSSTKKCLIDAGNNIYVIGIGTGPNGQVTKVKKFNPSGVAIWNYFDSGIGAPITFKFTPDNKIVIIHRGLTGSVNGFSKIDLNGNNIWSLGGVASLSVGDAAGDAFGNTYIINGSNPGSVLKKLSPTGAVIWSQPNLNNGNKVEVGSDNKPVVGGYPAAGYGVIFMKYDAAGNLLWQNLDADGPALALLSLAPMKLDISNAAYIAGSTMSQMGVCKVNSNGTPAWTTTAPGGYPVWFVFGTDYHVYLTGGTTAKISQPAPVLPCNPPVNLSITNKTATSVKLNFSAVSNIIRYQVYYKKSADTVWTKVNVGKTKTSLTVNNLVCSSAYKWKIRTVCDTTGSDIFSAFSAVKNFTTLSCRLAEAEPHTGIEIYPNPVKDMATLSIHAEGEESVFISILDIAGRVAKVIPLQIRQAGLNKITIDLSELNSGLYFCKVISEDKMNTVKLIKN